GLRLRAGANRSSLGGTRGSGPLLPGAPLRLPGHPLRPHGHRHWTAGRLRGGRRDGHPQRSVARGPAVRADTQLEGRDLLSVGPRAAPLPGREGLYGGPPAPHALSYGRTSRWPATMVVPPLQLPDSLPWVSRVVGAGDRPEGVRRLDDIADGLARAAGGTSDDAHHEGDGQEKDEEAGEHVFVAYRTPVRLSRPQRVTS